ncbi:MAG: transposase [Proteobacteria bacterium]|nr:transposase [Pseudomonadota bacterium]
MPAPEMVQLINVFTIAFTVPTWRHATVLLIGAILTPGRRTVASALRVMGMGDKRRFEKYHRLLNRSRWEALLLGRLLLGLIIKLCVPDDAPLFLAVDETLERRWGPKITNLGKFRDSVRSSK